MQGTQQLNSLDQYKPRFVETVLNIANIRQHF